MEEMDVKFICFYRRCVSNHKQIFTDNERRNHAGHWEDTRRFNSKEINEIIQVRGRYVRDACDWATQHLFLAVNSKMNRLHLSVEDKYWNATKNVIASRFSSLLGQNENIAEQFQEGLGQENKLWLLNNIYQGNEDIIREGIQVETLLLTKEITAQLEKQLEIITQELVYHNINILSSFSASQKVNVKEEEKSNMAELISIHSQASNNLEKTKPIKKKRGRKPLKRQKQESNDDARDIKPEPVRIKLFEINQKKDIINAVPCDRLVINQQITQTKVLELIIKLRPKQIINNVQISFSKSFLDKIPIQIKLNLDRFLEYWDFKDYYEKITDYLYFYSEQTDQASYKKLHMTSQNWKDLHNLKNIWIGNNQDLVQVKKANFKYDHITSLTLLPCQCCKKKSIPTDEILKEFDSITTLDTLVLSKVKINKETANIINNFILKNSNLTCLIVNYAGTIGNGFINAAARLKLTKLFIYNHHQPEEDLDFRPIFNIESLQYLTLQRARLTVEALKQISNLKSLVHLDLYDSYPVHSSVLDYLYTNTHRSLAHLNLGYCELEDLNVSSLRKFKALKNLNLDGSQFNCQKLFEELIHNPITCVTKLSIFNYHDEPLHLRRCRDKFVMNNQIFAMIAKAFPNLTYLAIGYDCMLKQIDLDKFKKLKTFLANEKCKNIIMSEDISKNCILSKEKFLN